MIRTTKVLAAVAVAAVFAACSSPAPPAVKWHKDGATEADLIADREACFDEASRVRGETRRFDHVAKGSHFMRCMTERGWRQVPADG